MNRVLVTGASGFIGRHSLALLAERGCEVHAVSRSGAMHDEHTGVVWHACNLLDGGQVRDMVSRIRPDYLLHLAWYAEPGKFWAAEINTAWVRASMELFRAFLAYGGRRIVAAGSCAEYDWEYGTFSENTTPLVPRTLYGQCKKQLFLELVQLVAGSAASMSWARIFFVYGPGEHRDRLVPSVILRLMKDEAAPCTAGVQVRDFLHVGDVAAALVMLLGSAVAGAINIGSGIPVEIRQIIQMIADRMSRPELPVLGAFPTKPDEPGYLVADNSRLASELGWRQEITLEDGLADTISWWSRHPEEAK